MLFHDIAMDQGLVVVGVGGVKRRPAVGLVWGFYGFSISSPTWFLKNDSLVWHFFVPIFRDFLVVSTTSTKPCETRWRVGSKKKKKKLIHTRICRPPKRRRFPSAEPAARRGRRRENGDKSARSYMSHHDDIVVLLYHGSVLFS